MFLNHSPSPFLLGSIIFVKKLRGLDRLKVVEDLGAFTSKVKPRLPPKLPRSSCALVFRGERLSWADSTGACWNKGALGPVFLSKRVAFFFWKGSQWKKTPMKFVEHFGTLRGFGVVFQKHPCFQGWCCFFKFQGMYIYSMFSFFIYMYIYLHIDRVSSVWGSSHCDRDNMK